MKKFISACFFSIGLIIAFISYTLFGYGAGRCALLHTIVGLLLAAYSAAKLCKYEEETK